MRLAYVCGDFTTTLVVSATSVTVNGLPDRRKNMCQDSFLAIDHHHYQQRMLETGDHERSLFAARYKFLPYDHEGLGKDYVSASIVFTLLDMMKYQGVDGGVFEYVSDKNVIKYGGVKRVIPTTPELDVIESLVRDLVGSPMDTLLGGAKIG